MRIRFSEHAWDDLLHWQRTDKKRFRRLTILIRDVERDPFDGIEKPEPLKGDLSGFWSRRLDTEHRLIYRVQGDTLDIIQCHGHYGD